MRERVGYGEVGRRGSDDEGMGRHGPGPRPVRPRGGRVSVRPREVPRPAGPGGRALAHAERGVPAGLRLLARRPGAAAVRCGVRHRLRRVVAGAALVAASAAAVVALGLLVRLVEPVSPAAVSGVSMSGVSMSGGSAVSGAVRPVAPVPVTAEPGETVWEVVDRVAPGLSGADRAALAGRIVADNALGSARPQPGQVLRVPAG